MSKDITIDFSEDYYGLLGLAKEQFTDGKTLAEKRVNSKLVHSAYVKKANLWHPDVKWRGDGPEPSEEDRVEMFKKIIKANTVLSNERLRRIYDKGEVEDVSSLDLKVEIDWSKIGRYSRGSMEETVGKNLLRASLSQIGLENATSIFAPSDEQNDNYIWEIYVSEDESINPITISINNDEEDVLRLTSGENIADSLPFRIYIFIPGKKVFISRDDDGNVSGCEMADYVLYEGTNMDDALDHVEKYMKKLFAAYTSDNLESMLQ